MRVLAKCIRIHKVSKLSLLHTKLRMLKIPECSGFMICVPKLMRSPYETKIILLLKATALAGALAAYHECPGARPFPSAPTQRLFLSFPTCEVLIGGLPAGEHDLIGVGIQRQQVLLLAGSLHPVHVPPSVDEALGPDCTQGFGTGV